MSKRTSNRGVCENGHRRTKGRGGGRFGVKNSGRPLWMAPIFCYFPQFLTQNDNKSISYHLDILLGLEPCSVGEGWHVTS